MPHIRKSNGQPCPGRPYQEATTMAIKCSVCREPIGPPPSANHKPHTAAATPQGVDAMLRKRLHPEQVEQQSPYAEAIKATTEDAFSLIAKKAQERRLKEREEAQAKAAEQAEAGGVAVAELPPEPEPEPLHPEQPPPLMAALQAAAAEGNAAKEAATVMPPMAQRPRGGRR